MRIHEVIIEVGDVDAAVTFYTEVIGMRHVRTVEHGGASIAELDADGQRVTLAPADTSGVRLALATASVRSRERRLRSVQAQIEGAGPVAVDGGRWLGFEDPWGNRLGFWESDDAAARSDGQG
jgi:catechol 2,3-dioxygenase-like lactoylglutathione lyase family enzyme